MINLHKVHYLPRMMEPTLKKYIGAFSVVAVNGPRQSGKSTLLLHSLKDDYRYVSFDDYRMIDMFSDDPEKFMQIYSDRVIFDEAQKVPELFNYIKIAVDNDRTRKGKFILTGSSQFSLTKKITESLAGRIGLLTLLPFQYCETPMALRDKAIYKGSYPELIGEKYAHCEEWYASYIETYLNKDVRSLSNIGDLRDFRRFVKMLGAQAAQIVNMSSFANDLGVGVSTIKRWLSLLEASYIIFLLPPYYENFGKRIIRSPKLYFYDTGLAAFLTGIKNKELFESGPMGGALFENYIIAEIAKKNIHTGQNSELFYLRTSNGVEIDLIVDNKNSKEWIEIKKSASFKPMMVKNIEPFLKGHDHGRLIYSGKSLPYTDKVSITNYTEYL